MNRKMPYSVPEGYFSKLNESLLSIPLQQSKLKEGSPLPYLALVAVFAVVFVLGGVFLNKRGAAQLGQDDMVEYLLESNLTLAQLEEIIYYINE